MRSPVYSLLARVGLPYIVALCVYRGAAVVTDWPPWLCKIAFLVAFVLSAWDVRMYIQPRMDWSRTAWIAVRLVSIAVLVLPAFCFAYLLSPLLVSWALADFTQWLEPAKYQDYGRWGLALVCAYFAHKGARQANLPARYDPTIRGRTLLAYDDAKRRLKALTTDQSPGMYQWGGLQLPDRMATTHFLVVGATGSGKTLTLRLLLKSVVAQMTSREHTRLLVYDAKQDVVAALLRLGVQPERIRILNPFDDRCVAWDISADITDPASAHQIATILVPADGDVNRFFTDAVRDILTGVLVTFILSGRHWTLRDVVLAMYSDRKRLRSILAAGPGGERFDAYFRDTRTYANIQATINTKMAPYSIVAAAWEGRPRVSLRDWFESPVVMVLGNHEACRAALDAINQVMFKRLTELILSLSEVPSGDADPRRLWIFLDEVREAGRLDGLSRLLTKGRSKGACVVLGFQDIEGMRDVYGMQVAHELTGECACKAVLRAENPNMAEWASSLFGVSEAEHYSYGSGGYSVSYGPRTLVMPSQIMDIPPTNPHNGLTGCYLVPDVGAYCHTATWPYLSFFLTELAEEAKGDGGDDFRGRVGEYQVLKAWGPDEVLAWGISPSDEESVATEQDDDGPDTGHPRVRVPSP